MTIRREQTSDAAAIFAVHARSFPSDAEARLVDLLRAAGSLSVSLVAEVDGHIVGHVAFSPVTVASEQSALKRSPGVGLAPVAVVEAFRRRGVAGELIRTGLLACRESGFGWAVVLGDPAYYARFGFRAASEFSLSDEYGGGPAFQAIELTSGALPRNAGLVRYAPEFAMFGESDAGTKH